MIERHLNLFDKLPPGIAKKDFSVWSTPYQFQIREWRQSRGQPERQRLKLWGEILTAGEHYFNRGVLHRVSVTNNYYLISKPWGKTMWYWERNWQKKSAIVCLNTVPDGYFHVLKDRLGNNVVDLHHMLWWEELYDACDVMKGAAGWWWMYLDNERAGIVCDNEMDAVMAATQITDA